MIRRDLQEPLRHSLTHFPAVMLLGARQVGKSTLAERLCESPWGGRYLTLDDRPTLDAALSDPDGFVRAAPDPVVIDEVQRAPDLLRAIKLEIDRDRRAGRFLLTGSANVLALRTVSESLAGRVAVHRLWPLSWAELHGEGPSSLLDVLFEAETAREALAGLSRALPGPVPDMDSLRRFILSGAFPTPALMDDARGRQTWFESFRQTYLERDLRDLTDVLKLPEFGRTMSTLSMRTGQLLNAAELSRDVGLPNTTLRRYLDLLELSFQFVRLRPYAANREKRLVRSPKVYAADTGLACHLAAVESWEALDRRNLVGAMLETWAHAELRKMMSLDPTHTELSFWRNRTGQEVDFLIERGGRVVGIEVKAAATIQPRDLRGIRAARRDFGSRWHLGVLIHGGPSPVAIDERTIAIPLASAFL